MQTIYWILALIFSLSAGLLVYRTDKKKQVGRPWLTGLLRALLCFFTCLLLLAPTFTTQQNFTRKPVVVVLQDNTQSFPKALLADSQQYQTKINQLVNNLSEDYQVVTWTFGGTVDRKFDIHYQEQTTDITEALLQTTQYYGSQNLSAIILATDGRYNQGVNPLYADIPLQGSLYVLAPGDTAIAKDISIVKVYVNPTITLNSQFEIRVDIAASLCAGYRDNLVLQEINGDKSASAQVYIPNNRYHKSLSFTLKADKPGIHHYRISIPTAEGERNTMNNSQDIFISVVDQKKKILLAAARPHPDIRAIHDALTSWEGFDVTVAIGGKIPANLAPYDILILHSLPSTQYPLPQLSQNKKPTWYIMGWGASNAGYNALQQNLNLNVNTNYLQPHQTTIRQEFSLFNLPEHFKGIESKLPPLFMPAGTIQQNPMSETLLNVNQKTAFPVWVFGKENIPSVLLVGEGLWRWRMASYRHLNHFTPVDELIRQTVSYLANYANSQPFKVWLPKKQWNEQEIISMQAELRNAANEQVNNPEVQLTLTDATGKTQEYTFEKAGDAYRLMLGQLASGKYHYKATVTHLGQKHTAEGSFAVQSIPLEMLTTGTDYPLLYTLSHKYMGAVFTVDQIESLQKAIRENEQIKPIIETREESHELIDRKWYFLILLLLATSEWLYRKYQGM